MTSTCLLTAIATAAVFMSGAALAGHDREETDRTGQRVAQDSCRTDGRDDGCRDRGYRARDRHEARARKALLAVPNDSLPGQASYGWQYFSNARSARAVVISPSGEYFVSRGDGPRQITGPEGEMLMARSVPD